MEQKKRNILARFPLLSFFILAYAINILFTYGSAYVLKIPDFALTLLQIFSPTFSAVIVAFAIGGWAEIKRLFGGFGRWKASIWWYLAAFSLTLIPLLFALVYIALGNSVPCLDPKMTVPLLVGNAFITLLRGPLSEETGWRGFALPRLQKKFNALVSSLILGAIWACWHLPFYAISGGGAGLPFPVYFVMVVVLTVFITWVYNNTNGSLGLCVLTHFAFNFSSAFIAGYLGLLPRMVFNMYCGALLGVYVVVVVLVFGAKRLSRKAPAGVTVN